VSFVVVFVKLNGMYAVSQSDRKRIARIADSLE